MILICELSKKITHINFYLNKNYLFLNTYIHTHTEKMQRNLLVFLSFFIYFSVTSFLENKRNPKFEFDVFEKKNWRNSTSFEEYVPNEEKSFSQSCIENQAFFLENKKNPKFHFDIFEKRNWRNSTSFEDYASWNQKINENLFTLFLL